MGITSVQYFECHHSGDLIRSPVLQLCTILPGQRYKRSLSTNQRQAQIDQTRQSPDIRQKLIQEVGSSSSSHRVLRSFRDVNSRAPGPMFMTVVHTDTEIMGCSVLSAGHEYEQLQRRRACEGIQCQHRTQHETGPRPGPGFTKGAFTPYFHLASEKTKAFGLMAIIPSLIFHCPDSSVIFSCLIGSCCSGKARRRSLAMDGGISVGR